MSQRFDAALAARFARLAMDCVTREYPNKIAHTMQGDADARAPRLLTPAFYGCYDWHSAVHGHWLLARVARLFPQEAFAVDARSALARNLTPANIAGEVGYLRGEDRAAFERPYGLAWLLTLGAELRLLRSPWEDTLAPLENLAVEHLASWLPKLEYPDRAGQHSNTAFALGLALDWARAVGRREFEQLICTRARNFYLRDRNAPLAFEPSGEDFLSPCLAEADLMRRVLDREAFGVWLGAFLPDVSPLAPLVCPDPTDGKLAHFDGLNLSRAWMLRGIHPALAEAHADAGLRAVTGEHYAGGHWLATFAVYWLTR